MEGFFIIAERSFFESLTLAFASHHDIFYRQFFEKRLLFLQFSLQLRDGILLSVDDAEFAAEQALCGRFLYVVTAVDGQKQIVEGALHVALVEGARGIVILLVGPALFERRVDGVAVVVAAGKAVNLGADKYILAPDGLLEADALQRCAAGERHVSLSASEDTSGEVYLHVAERESLALMDLSLIHI